MSHEREMSFGTPEIKNEIDPKFSTPDNKSKRALMSKMKRMEELQFSPKVERTRSKIPTKEIKNRI